MSNSREALMNIYIHVLMVMMSFLTVGIQGMDTRALENLEETAWRQAFAGNSGAALEQFTVAADAGSWQAAKFLAYNYKTEPLVDALDDEKAAVFDKKADTYKRNNPNKYFSDFDLQSKIKKLKVLQFARTHDWYQALLAELNRGQSEYSQSFPLPEDSLFSLFQRIANDKADDQQKQNRMQMLCHAMRQMRSERAIKDILAKMSHGYSGVSFSDDGETHYKLTRELMGTLDGLAAEFNLSDDLKKAYEKTFSDFHGNYLGLWREVDKSVIVSSMVELFPRYMALDRSGAVKMLAHFLEHDLKSSWRVEDDFLRLLRLLPDEELTSYVPKIMKPKVLPNFIKALCENNDLAVQFDGTVLDRNAIVKNLFSSYSGEKHESESLEGFFKHGGIDFYRDYEDEIMRVVPLFLKNSVHKYESLFPMATLRGCPRLQESVQRALIEASCIQDSFWQEYILKNLFEISDFNQQEKTTLYERVNAVCQELKGIAGLQRLWLHLQNDAQQRDLLHNSVLHYFGLTHDALSVAEHVTFESFFNAALCAAQERGSISQEQFTETLKIAHETKLASIIDPGCLETQKDAIIYNEQAAFAQRATFLDQRLKAMKSGIMVGQFLNTLPNNLVDEEFKTYVNNIHTALLVNSSSFDVCKAKKALQLVHKKYDMEQSMPHVVWGAVGDLPNFSYYRYSPAKDRPINRISLDKDLSNVQVSADGLLFGLQWQHPHYSLWAIDATSLDGVWQASISMKEKAPYAFDDATLYLADGADITYIDKKTGIALNQYSFNNALPITFLATDHAGLLYVVQDDKRITRVNAFTGESLVLEDDIGDGGKRYFMAGTTLCYYYMPDNTIHVYPKDQPKQVIQTAFDSKQWIFNSRWAVHNSQLFFVRLVAEDTYQLVCFDIIGNREKWHYPLARGLKTHPCVSADGKRIFILDNKYHVIALEDNDDQAQLLWDLTIPKTGWINPIDQITIAPDGKILFGLESCEGKLYTIDAQAGILTSTSECKEGRTKYFVGFSQEGLPYIRPVYF